ncbi:glucose/arabinose dehydrogenase/cytochrome c551/c552 [Pedobacter sp. AK017]|uniref:PQQ-dependent sugar dehydrogenase n=1 Tax=Pedobacter sp. AK017 TaxID=2723073 RepID=UPI001614EC3A|nr:PQQ-dependent sugar dehydrogenase [Pedobacter sp. AK017]MBB5440743.1 glucose/arabinose dehydrogenase/cytochrome c551/c552 [Pedobacter sp. AK017]
MKTLFTLTLSGITFLLLFLFGPAPTAEKRFEQPGIVQHPLNIDTPDQRRFVKVDLVKGKFTEPTEMAVLPNLDILVAQRRGEIMLYKQQSRTLKEVLKLDVYFKTTVSNVNAEEGLLGIAPDPNFAANQYIYVFYSPFKTSVNRLSRFKLVNDRINPASEKKVLEFYSQREICCHTGGSIAFGPDGLLYVSTGDNSTPFDVPKQTYVNKGYAPLDNRPGLHQYDARRSAGNTNDLRGKILRIRVNADGTYSIPDGNLFPKNEPKTKPEIYVMGDRNPYRISVDQKTGFLYWGEVGPDASADNELRGPRGYDEINQARKAGNFGWPLFIANNYPYRAFDYTNGQSGAAFDALAPVNNSPNNTGLTQLPKAEPAYIWYAYGASSEFPQVGAGGRTAMAGPVYHTKTGLNPYPAYYNGKLIIYDWVRGWVKAVSMSPEGDYLGMEPFLSNISLSAPIDMELGPDGKLYVLEYGKGWFTKNPDAGISRIDYLKGNRPPVMEKFEVLQTSGLLPYKLLASVKANDPDGDALTYVWSLGKGVKKTTNKPELEYTFTKAGEYPVSVKVVDASGAAVSSNVVPVFAGNEQPKIDIQLSGNKSFYFPGIPVDYKVLVSDKGAAVHKNRVYISSTYTEGLDLAGAQLGHQEAAQTLVGKSLMLKADCSTCHKIAATSIGPAFTRVSAKYQQNNKAVTYLSGKVMKGSSGVWGEVPMPAHATMKETEVRQIVEWIMSLAAKASGAPSLPMQGKIVPPATVNTNKPVLSLKATYADMGMAGVRSLSSTSVVNLRSNVIDVKDITDISQFSRRDISGEIELLLPKNTGWIKLKQIDLKGITSFLPQVKTMAQEVDYEVEMKLDNQNGVSVGKGLLSGKSIAVDAVADGKLHDVFITFKGTTKDIKERPLLQEVVLKGKGSK